MDQASFVAALIDKVSGPARKMKGQLAGLSKAFRDVNKAGKRDEMGRFIGSSSTMLGKLTGTFKGAGKALSGAVESGVSKLKEGLLIGGIVAAGTAAGIGALTVKMADFAQTSRLGYQAVAKHGENAEALFTHSRMLAQDLGLDVMDTSKSFTKLMALQFSSKMATDLIKMGADMRALGTSSEGVQNILAQLGQVQAKGRLQGEELTVLAENGLSTQLVYKHLASQLGKTKDEILSMQQAGKLTSDMAFPAIMAAVMEKTGEKQLGDVGKAIADKTLSGMAGQLKAKAQNAFINIGSGATPAIMDAFRPMADELGQLFQSDSFQRGLIGAVETVAQFAREAIPLVKEFVGSLGQGFMEAWPAMEGAIGVLFDGFGPGGGAEGWIADVKTLGKTLGQVAAAAVTVGVVFGGMLVGGVQIVTGMVQGLIYMWDGLISGIGAAAFAVSDFFSNIGAKWRAFDFSALAGSLIDGLVSGISNGAQWVYEAIASLGAGVIRKFKDVLDINSPSKEFKYLGQMSGLGYSMGLERSLAANDNWSILPSAQSLAGGTLGGSERTLPSMTGSVGSLMGAGGEGGGGDINVTVHMENHFSGGDSEAHARTIKRSLETELGGVFERLAAGAAA